MKTQAEFLFGCGERRIADGEEGPWGAFQWRSGALKRVVASTLAAKTQSALNAQRELVWAATFLCSLFHGALPLESRGSVVRKMLPTTLGTDCKSLYDLLVAPTVTTNSGRDRETSVDVLLLKQALRKAGAEIRWAPGTRQIADALTKDAVEGNDAMKGVIKQATYAIGAEERALEVREKEKAARLACGRARQAANEARQALSVPESPGGGDAQ